MEANEIVTVMIHIKEHKYSAIADKVAHFIIKES